MLPPANIRFGHSTSFFQRKLKKNHAIFVARRWWRWAVAGVWFRRSFGTPKCCHPQISDLGFIISWWQLSCEIFLQILTSLELHSNSANRPGILLSHDGSLEVNLLMIFLELSLKKTSRMTKSDIWGWQHLRLPKYLLDPSRVCHRPGLMTMLTSSISSQNWSLKYGRSNGLSGTSSETSENQLSTVQK